MRRILTLAALAAALHLPAGSPAAAQDAPAPAAEYAAPAQAQAQPLPAEATVRSTPPRTLRAHAHVYAAFAATWLLLFGYAVSIGRRARRIEDELNSLRG